MARVLRFAKENGPFDGLMGFSQGSSLAAAVLASQEDGSNELVFSLGILFCGGRPTEPGFNTRWPKKVNSANSSISSGLSTMSSSSENSSPRSSTPSSEFSDSLLFGPKVKVPTVHFAGRKDSMYEETLNLYHNADSRNSTLWEFEDGHTIPRTSVETKLMADQIREGLFRSRIWCKYNRKQERYRHLQPF